MFFAEINSNTKKYLNVSYNYKEIQAFQWIFCGRAINHLCKDVFSKIAINFLLPNVDLLKISVFIFFDEDWKYIK